MVEVLNLVRRNPGRYLYLGTKFSTSTMVLNLVLNLVYILNLVLNLVLEYWSRKYSIYGSLCMGGSGD